MLYGWKKQFSGWRERGSGGSIGKNRDETLSHNFGHKFKISGKNRYKSYIAGHREMSVLRSAVPSICTMQSQLLLQTVLTEQSVWRDGL